MGIKGHRKPSLLAYEMNGEPLPLEHGYPLRALAAGGVDRSRRTLRLAAMAVCVGNR